MKRSLKHGKVRTEDIDLRILQSCKRGNKGGSSNKSDKKVGNSSKIRGV